jgi:hypothetical protein
MLAIQPAVLLSMKGSRVVLEGLNGAEFDNLLYIEFPLLFKIYPFSKMEKIKPNLIFGPYAGINVSSRYETTGDVAILFMLSGLDEEGEIEDVKKTDYGFVLGLGFDASRYLFEFTYSLGLTTIDDSFLNQDLKNNVIAFVVGYKF